ncbi:MAG: ATP-dependent Clp protease ATP-binding subunit [Acidobacteria bacterium]|nr:ATP-dependent Clp protease ATP-binding subunit [Acidobacteriota bacterium]MBI3663660.1 ATP-dependent Clp protease ATP-binding subunit [Acidobacteriota bacterium]
MQHLDPNRRSGESREFEAALRKKIVGQDEAIGALVDIYQVFRAGLHSPGRPVSNLLFLGPTGSGKTRIVEAMGEILFGDPHAVIKVDCAEFQHSHEIAKLIGSPPGYLGHRETHPLITQEALAQYHTDTVKLSLLLFDEIEKASDALWQLLLGILDKATLTLGDNRRVDLSQTLIFMTSNLGGADISTLMSGGLGFVQPSDKPSDKMDTKVERTATEAAKRKFSPEFMNRIDKVVVFHPLRPAQLEQVLDIELDLVQRRVLDTAHGQFVFRLTRAARDFLLREGTDIKYGARHLKRAIERHVVYPLANLLSTGQILIGDVLSIDWDAATQQLSFARTGESTLVTMAPPAALFAAQAVSTWGGRAIEIPAQANARETQSPVAAPAPPAPAPVAASRRRHDPER